MEAKEKSRQGSINSRSRYNQGDDDSDSSGFEIPESMRFLYNLFERFIRDTHEDSSDERERNMNNMNSERQQEAFQNSIYQYLPQDIHYNFASDADRQAFEYLISQNLDHPEVIQQLLLSLQAQNQQDQSDKDQDMHPINEITRNQMLLQHLNSLQYENLENNLKYATQDPDIKDQILAHILQQNPSEESNALAILLSQLLAANSPQIPQPV